MRLKRQMKREKAWRGAVPLRLKALTLSVRDRHQGEARRGEAMKAEGGGQNDRSKTASDVFQKPPDIYLLSSCSARTIQSKRPAILHLWGMSRVCHVRTFVIRAQKQPSWCAVPINVGARPAVVCQRQVCVCGGDQFPNEFLFNLMSVWSLWTEYYIFLLWSHPCFCSSLTSCFMEFHAITLQTSTTVVGGAEPGRENLWKVRKGKKWNPSWIMWACCLFYSEINQAW